MTLSHSISTPRIASIDIFRAITMFFMIFVNDLWSITNVPHWLEHAAGNEDMLGFSDIVFPSFLFILGMSIPLAIEKRLQKKDSKFEIIKHIVIRAIALLVMGLFTVNTESGVSPDTGMSRSVFILLMLLGFFLIWNVYPRTENKTAKYVYNGLKIAGVAVLLFLLIIFRDASGEPFQKHWWGILGLIGWTYLLCAIIYLFLRRNWIYLMLSCIAFVVLCIAGANGWLGGFSGIIPGDGCFHAFTMSGVLLTLLFNKSETEIPLRKKLLIAFGAGVAILLLGWLSHSWWIISKLQATPTWLFLCSGISILFYIFIYWLTDMQGKANWFNIIKPAGTATLTCYLVPYLLYSIFTLTAFSLPAEILTSPMGLVKCVIFSFVTIGITALLGKAGVKLKI
ncbi:DUF5009 domain-containing protein [Dysgonomonas sp. ZJ279]|uniref:DUF5009 domain-containing protein n=1 Tax=Dysgonomonas sp. ZJ279 TaxID=2709796 RepID=UPI0013EB50BB|nr:DUF5009 domain-containing protein [Dysgonomonas sp. ZJ279]